MTIHSRPNNNRISEFGSLIFCFATIYFLVKEFSVSLEVSLFKGVFSIAAVYFTLIIISDLYTSYFLSPSSIELKDKSLVIKMPFQKSYSVDVASVERIAHKKIFLIGGFYDTLMHFPDSRKILYFDTIRFENLSEFLLQVKKENPACKIDDKIDLSA